MLVIQTPVVSLPPLDQSKGAAKGEYLREEEELDFVEDDAVGTVLNDRLSGGMTAASALCPACRRMSISALH